MQSNFGAGDTSLTFISGIGGGGVVVNNAYGSFYDTTTQTSAGNVNLPMKLNNTDTLATRNFSIANDLLGNPTRITPNTSGIFNLQFSAQINRSSGGTKAELYIWLSISETYVPYSATVITLANNRDYIVPAWNFFVPLSLGQYCQLYWRATDPTIQILSNTSVDGVPNIPSLILTMQKIAELP